MPAVFLPFMPLLLAVALTFGFFTLMDSQAAKYLDACRVASLRAVENGLSTVRGLENLNPRAKFLSLERAKVELRLSNALAHRNSKAIANAKAQREDIIQQQVVLGRSQKAMVAAYFALLKTGAAQIQQEIRGSGTTSLTNNKIQFLVVIPQFHFPLTPDVDGRPAPEYVYNSAYSHSLSTKWSLDFAVDLLGHKPSIRLNQQCGAKIEKRRNQWFANLTKDKFF